MKKRILFGTFFIFGIIATYTAISKEQPQGLQLPDDGKNYRVWCQDTLSYRGCGIGNGPECSSIKSC